MRPLITQTATIVNWNEKKTFVKHVKSWESYSSIHLQNARYKYFQLESTGLHYPPFVVMIPVCTFYSSEFQ